MLELKRPVEMVDYGALAAAGDHDHLLDPARDRFLDAVLDGGLVDQGQHLLRLRLGGGQEAGAKPGGGDDRLANSRDRHPGQSKAWRALTAFSPASRAGSSAWSTGTSSPGTWAGKARLRPRR